VDIALLITNVSQLIAVLGAADQQPFFVLLVTMLLISILLQASHIYSVWVAMTEYCMLTTVYQGNGTIGTIDMWSVNQTKTITIFNPISGSNCKHQIQIKSCPDFSLNKYT